MAVDPWLVFALLIGGFLVVGTLVTYAYWRLTRPPPGTAPEDPAAAWREEATALVREVREVATRPGPVDQDALDRQVLPLAYRLRGHARGAPPGVDDGLTADLFALGTACYRIGMDHSPQRAARTGVFVEDLLADLADDAADLERALDSAEG